jgi:hypothetical protein
MRKRMLSCFFVTIAATLALFCSPPNSANAQGVNLFCWTGPNAPQWQPCSTNNPLAVNASVSASITGFPGTTQTTGTPISVTNAGVTGTLPAGTVVVASNVGTTNNAYCKLGASATTSDQLIAPSSWFGFTVGTNTQLTCITSTSTTTVNMVGGAGLPTGAGGGGGGGAASSVSIAQGGNTALVKAGNTAGTTDIALVVADPNLLAAVQATGTVQGGAANGVATLGNPLQAGCVAESTETPVVAGQAASVMCGLERKVLTLPWANKENMLRCAVTITASTAATTCTGMGAQGGTNKIYITDGYCTRSDAGTTAVTMTTNAQDTSATNNIIFDMPNNGGGGGFVKPGGGVPWVVAANTAFQLTSGTSISSEHCSFSGYFGQ